MSAAMVEKVSLLALTPEYVMPKAGWERFFPVDSGPGE